MEDEDVPPLEDLTDVLAKRKKATQPKYETRSRMRGENTATTSAAAEKESPPPPLTADGEKKTSFGGFSKGFLLSNSSSSVKETRSTKKESNDRGKRKDGSEASKEEDIPFLKPQVPQTKAPVIPEVQEAMKGAFSLMDTQDWMTDSLLEKIEKHPLLSRALRDPALAQALSQFQTDPESVLRSAAGNPQLQEILREFCSVMGSHFTELADRQDTEKHDENFVSIEPDKEVDEVLGREGVKEALSDPQIQRLFSLLRGEDSAKAQRMLSSADQELKQKVQLLIDNGLLSLQ